VKLGTTPPEDLIPMRQQLHRAIQVPASVGDTLARTDEYGAAASFKWLDHNKIMAGYPIGGDRPVRAGLSLIEFSLMLLDESNQPVGHLPLAGNSLRSCYDWMQEQVKEYLDEAGKSKLKPRTIADSDNPIGTGEIFQVEDADALTELSIWFDNFHAILTEIAKSDPQALEVNIYPHHFDISVFLKLEEDKDIRSSRSVIIGMEPGDKYYPEPYVYVNPWPYPENKRNLPKLKAGGVWHTKHWTGAVLTCDKIIPSGRPSDQAERVFAFINSAVPICRELAEAKAVQA
jgi:hypothetical protein